MLTKFTTVANIFVRNTGKIKLADFGTCTSLSQLTNLKERVGTPYYMSPEQAQGKKLDASSDIYSIGILLYEMLVGKAPFLGKDAIAVAVKHVSAPVPDLPENLRTIQPLVNRMLAKRPGARFRNAHELTQAIDLARAQNLRHETDEISLKMKLAKSRKPRK